VNIHLLTRAAANDQLKILKQLLLFQQTDQSYENYRANLHLALPAPQNPPQWEQDTPWGGDTPSHTNSYGASPPRIVVETRLLSWTTLSTAGTLNRFKLQFQLR